MTDLNDIADQLNRLIKLALDTGEASTIEEAHQIFAGYRMQIVVGADVAHCPVLQAALLTAVNCATRSLLGGVVVVGATGSLCVPLPPYADTAEALIAMGATLAVELEPDTSTLVIGDIGERGLEPLAIRATVGAWCGGVAPVTSGFRLAEIGDFTPAGVLAGALGVSEIFQRLRGGNPAACRRAVGVDLSRPERNWWKGGDAPPLERLPSAAWLVGLGNLGQAYLWTLGLLPYGSGDLNLTLQDTDVLAPSNLSTSILTRPALLGHRKSRVMAAWAELRGFKTSLVERTFAADFRISAREPSVALFGVDNALARQAAEEVGFARVIEAGLGGGTQDFLGIDLHTFPASTPARALWRDATVASPTINLPAYSHLLQKTKDMCGTVRLAGRSIGAPFVGAAASTLVVAEFVRLGLGAHRYEMLSCHLRGPERLAVVPGALWEAFNPGTVDPRNSRRALSIDSGTSVRMVRPTHADGVSQAQISELAEAVHF